MAEEQFDTTLDEKPVIEEPKPPKPKKSYTGLIIVILLIVIVGLIFFIFVYTKGNGGISELFKKKTATATTTQTTESSATKTTSKSLTKTVDPYSGWKSYKSDKYALSFKYPSDWNDATEGKNEDLEMIPVDYTGISFGDDSKYSVALSKTTDYTDQSKDSVDLLKRIFDGSSNEVTTIWLPPGNAAIQAYVIPKYIETTDRKWRGIYYFANIGNGYSTAITALAVLTDGNDNIVQLSLTGDSIKSSEYPCISGEQTDCSSSKLEEQVSGFHEYINTIDEANSSETVIKDFHSTLKKVVASLQSV